MEVTSASCLAVTGPEQAKSEEIINFLYLFRISYLENWILETT